MSRRDIRADRGGAHCEYCNSLGTQINYSYSIFWFYCRSKERCNFVSLLQLSIFPAVCGTFYLISLSVSSAETFAAVVYGLSLMTLFGMSTAFHCSCYCGCEGKVKFRLHICDRATIFVFIGCSYTPW